MVDKTGSFIGNKLLLPFAFVLLIFSAVIPSIVFLFKKMPLKKKSIEEIKRFIPSKPPYIPPEPPISSRLNEDVFPRSVFISYSHANSDVARKIKSKLEENGIKVKIDSEDLKPGKNIQQFIINAIKSTDVTLSIISNKSLESSWVTMETINTFYFQKFDSNKKFIACFLDDDFLNDNYLLLTAEKIDDQLSNLNNLINKQIKKKFNTRNLNFKKTRLMELKNNLDGILEKLYESYLINIKSDEFDKNILKIINEINN